MNSLTDSNMSFGLCHHLRYTLLHMPPFELEELAEISLIIVKYENVWSPYKNFIALESLTVKRALIDSLAPLVTLSHLNSTELIQGTLRDISDIRSLGNLFAFRVPYNFIQDISPLLELPKLQFLDLRGNPLSEHSYFKVIAQLKERGVAILFDNEDTWRLCREIHRHDPRATYGDDGRGPRLVVPELQFEYFEKGILKVGDEIESRPPLEVIRQALDADEFDAAELALEYWDRPYRYEFHHTVLSAGGVRTQIKDAELENDLKASLTALHDRIEAENVAGWGIAQEDEAVFKEIRGRLYEWRSFPEPDRPGLPGWWTELRRIWAYPAVEGEPAWLRFGDGAPQMLAGEAIWLASPGVSGDAQAALVDHHRLFPVAWGPQYAWCLAIGLGEPSNSGIYLVERDRVFEWDYEPVKVFADFGELIEAVAGIAGPDAFEDAPTSRPPYGPSWKFDHDAHHQRGRADDAREWVEESALAEPVRRALADLVEGFKEVVYVREDEAKLQYWETRNGVRFPAWYRDLRKTIAWVEDSDGNKLSWSTGRWVPLNSTWITAWPGAGGDEHHLVIQKLKMLRIAQSMYKDLLIKLESANNRALYLFDREVHRDGEYRPAQNRQCADIAVFFNRVVALVNIEGEQVAKRASSG